jgi:hypothetical protein
MAVGGMGLDTLADHTRRTTNAVLGDVKCGKDETGPGGRGAPRGENRWRATWERTLGLANPSTKRQRIVGSCHRRSSRRGRRSGDGRARARASLSATAAAAATRTGA